MGRDEQVIREYIRHQEMRARRVDHNIESKQFNPVEVVNRVGLSTRRVRRLQKQHHQEGKSAFTSKRLGKPSNHQLMLSVESVVSAIVAVSCRIG